MPRKSVSIDGFWIFAFSILMVLVILLENDVFLNCQFIYISIFILLWVHFARSKYWSISVKDFKIIEAFTLRCLLITWAYKISKVLILKLTADLM